MKKPSKARGECSLVYSSISVSAHWPVAGVNEPVNSILSINSVTRC